jgi:hypothetical protein
MNKICLLDNNKNKDEHRFCYRKTAPTSESIVQFGIDMVDSNYIADYEWPAEFEYKSLVDLQNYILNKDPSLLNQEFPSHYIYSIYNRSDFLVYVQPTLDIVGGKKASNKTLPERIQFNYDEYAIYITLKLVNLIDKRDQDIYDLGVGFLNSITSLFFDVDFTDDPIGFLYIRSDIKILSKRSNPMDE